jgi:predicted metal-dependent hydrolase
MHQIQISNFTIDVVRKGIKNMHLSVYPPTGRVRIAVPTNIDDATVKLFALSKLAWIKRNQRKFAKQERESKRVFLDRESHYFEGKRYLLRVTEFDASPKVLIKTKTYIDMLVRPNTNEEQRQSILNEWYREHLKSKIPQIIEKWERVIGVEVANWGVKQMKTKWGTCNIEAKRIWINLEIAKKPNNCLEYIVVHEMIHLLERYHNSNFYNLLEKYMPNWKVYRDELNRLPVKYENWSY